MATHPWDDDKQDEEHPRDEEDQSPPEVIPNSHAAKSPFRSVLDEFTAAAKRDASGAAHWGLRLDARRMVGRDHQFTRCLESEVPRVVASHRSVVELAQWRERTWERGLQLQQPLTDDSRLNPADLQLLSIREGYEVAAARHHMNLRNRVDRCQHPRPRRTNFDGSNRTSRSLRR